MRRPRSQLSIRLYREYSPPRLPPDKAPTLLSANDKDKASSLLEFAPEPDRTDVASANRAIPDLVRARLISLSFCGQTFLSAIAAPALEYLSGLLFPYFQIFILAQERSLGSCRRDVDYKGFCFHRATIADLRTHRQHPGVGAHRYHCDSSQKVENDRSPGAKKRCAFHQATTPASHRDLLRRKHCDHPCRPRS